MIKLTPCNQSEGPLYVNPAHIGTIQRVMTWTQVDVYGVPYRVREEPVEIIRMMAGWGPSPLRTDDYSRSHAVGFAPLETPRMVSTLPPNRSYRDTIVEK